MKVAVFGRNVSQEFKPVLNRFFNYLEKNNIEVQLYKPFKAKIEQNLNLTTCCSSHFRNYKDFDNDNDLIFSIGGDGTFLHSVVAIRNFDIPVVGVNIGRLGFLADIAADVIEKTLDDIFSQKAQIVERSMLQVNIKGKELLDFSYALNELAILKSDTSSMINIVATVGDELLNNYWADGLIIATPTGSTAYSLSVGGPILTPESQNFVITPLAPHNLTVRPLVVPDHFKIKLKVEGRENQYLTSLDYRSKRVDFNTTIEVKKADFKLKTLQLPEHGFFNTLRNKLMWGVDKRN